MRRGLALYEEGKISVRTERVLIKTTGEFIRAARRASESFRQKLRGENRCSAVFYCGIRGAFCGFAGSFMLCGFADFSAGCL